MGPITIIKTVMLFQDTIT